MRWALVGLALLLAAYGLLHRGSSASVPAPPGARAEPGVAEPGATAVSIGDVVLSAPADRTPQANQMSASQAWSPGPSPAPTPADANAADSSPSAREQRVFRARHALETVDPREILRGTK